MTGSYPHIHINAAVLNTHTWAESTEISDTYYGTALQFKANWLPWIVSSWLQIDRVFLQGALFFFAFVRPFKYTALRCAHKLADTHQKDSYCFDIRELLCNSLVCINEKLEKMEVSFHTCPLLKLSVMPSTSFYSHNFLKEEQCTLTLHQNYYAFIFTPPAHVLYTPHNMYISIYLNSGRVHIQRKLSFILEQHKLSMQVPEASNFSKSCRTFFSDIHQTSLFGIQRLCLNLYEIHLNLM